LISCKIAVWPHTSPGGRDTVPGLFITASVFFSYPSVIRHSSVLITRDRPDLRLRLTVSSSLWAWQVEAISTRPSPRCDRDEKISAGGIIYVLAQLSGGMLGR
jgi:hypothetical protein